jgi:hypothetical protein
VRHVVLTPEERAAQLAADEREFRRRRRWRILWQALGFFGSCAAGLALVGHAFHTADRAWGEISLLLGILVGNGGIMVTLFLAWRRRERDGDV